MRRLLSRAAITAAVTVLPVLLPAAPAAAATSDSCDPARSTRLLTVPILGSPDNRLWVDQQSATRLVVCFDFPFGNVGGGAIVVDAAAGGSLPSITEGNDPAACNLELLEPNDPVDFTLAINALTATVCFTMDGQTTTLTFHEGSPGVPSLQIWRDGTFDWIDIAACGTAYPIWLLGGPDTCMVTNARIL